MVSKELKRKLEGRMEALAMLIDSEIQSLCEAKGIIETIYYLNYLLQKDDLE